MNIEDILLSNIEYNKTAEESDKRPEKILRFFRLFAVKNNTDNNIDNNTNININSNSNNDTRNNPL